MQLCRTCGQFIRWEQAVDDRWFPLDADPAPAGNVTLDLGRAVVYPTAADVPPGARERFSVHRCAAPAVQPPPHQADLFPGQAARERERGDSL